MALTDVTTKKGTITISDVAGYGYSFVGTDKDGKVIRKDLTAPLAEPRLLTYGHTSAVKTGVARHLVRLDRTVLEGTEPYKGSVYVVFEVPKAGVESTELVEMFAELVSVVSPSGFIASFIAGGV